MKTHFILFLLVFSTLAFSQTKTDVKLKKDVVYVNGNECLKYESAFMGSTTNFYTLKGEKIFYIDVKDAGKYSSGYIKIGFFNTEEHATMKNEFTRSKLIKGLIEEGALENCTINKDNLKNFINRYDQRYEENKVRF